MTRLKDVEVDVACMKRNGNERDEALKGYLVKEAERRWAALEDTEHLLRICKLPFNNMDSSLSQILCLGSGYDIYIDERADNQLIVVSQDYKRCSRSRYKKRSKGDGGEEKKDRAYRCTTCTSRGRICF